MSAPGWPEARWTSWLERVARWAGALALFVWLGARYWPQTIDDSVISINYARQWAEGHGLTWTTGERVEGYSNFLLVALLAAGIRLGADAALLAQWISVSAVSVVFGLLSWRLPRGLAGLAALLALAVWGPLDYWGMLGLEGPLFGLLLGSGWALAAGGRWGPGVAVLGLASLTRPEGPLYLGLAILFRARGPRTWGRGDGLAVAALLLVGGVHLARVTWFGALWPAPYLVKIAAVPWTRFGFAQLAADLGLALPVLATLGLAVRLRPQVALVALVPLLAQGLLLWRASGDWMAHGRFVLPGLIATFIVGASLGEARRVGAAMGVAGLTLSLLAAQWMSTGYGVARWEARELDPPAAVHRALTRGLETPLSEDVLWASRNVPAGDRALVVDAGMLGAVPGLLVIDMRGLNHRGFAVAAAQREEERYMQALVADSTTRPEWLRIANWDGAELPTLPDWLAAQYHLRAEVRYGPARIGWYSTHDQSADQATATERLVSLWAAYPSQPFLAWHAALGLSESGQWDRAMRVMEDAQRRWPDDARFSEAPASLSFTAGPFGMDYVAGRGVGLYWNDRLQSRPFSDAELPGLALALDVDAPGDDGAKVRLRWVGPCGEEVQEISIRAPLKLPPPACDRAGMTQLEVSFLNDANTIDGDRNIYVRMIND